MKELFDEIGKCIRCGFCEAVCPTLEAKDFRLYYGPRGRIILINEFLRNGREVEIFDSVYSCLECFLCYETCPAKVNAGVVCGFAKRIVAENLDSYADQVHPAVKLIRDSILRYGNPLGVNLSGWAKGLSFNPSSKNLLYTGGMYQIMPYAKRIVDIGGARKLLSILSRFPALVKLSRFVVDRKLKAELEKCLHNIVRLLSSSGIDFKYSRDFYPGTLLYDLGFVDEFEEHAKIVAGLLAEERVERIITVDPHTHYMLSEVYPKYVDFDFEVVHYLELLNVKFRKYEGVITYHEPCIFSRKLDFFTPNSILENIAEVVYPRNSGRKSMCCGGPVESLFPEITEKIAAKRFQELKDTGAEKIITACPICYVNLKKDPSVIDISEFLIKNKL